MVRDISSYRERCINVILHQGWQVFCVQHTATIGELKYMYFATLGEGSRPDMTHAVDWASHHHLTRVVFRQGWQVFCVQQTGTIGKLKYMYFATL